MQLLKIPKAAENLEEATIGRWLKKPGDRIEAGEPVVELLTDKADFALEAETNGYMRLITASEKSTIPVGYIIAVIAEEGEQLPDIDAANRQLMESAAIPRKHVEQKHSVKPKMAANRTPATPAAKKLARENGVSLSDVAAALRKNGVISADDVQKFLDAGGRSTNQ